MTIDLDQILSEEQYIRVKRMLSCDTGKEMRLSAIKEYYRRPDVADRIVKSGYDTNLLAHLTIMKFQVNDD